MNTGAKIADSWQAWEGHLVRDRFPLLRLLGASAHSAVFLTERSGGSGPAAIKIVLADPIAAELFLARWHRAAALSHPNLLALWESGRGDWNGIGFAYLVTEQADESLAQVDRRLTEQEARDLLGDAVSALTYLREHGLAHGHVHPSNILAKDERIVLSSDSIRPIGEWRADLESTSPYSAPETAAEGATPEGDIWSLGATMQHALGDSPGALREPIEQCLRADPRRRATDGDLAYFLRVSALAPSRARQTTSPRRTPLFAAIAGLCAIALAGALWVWRTPDVELAPPGVPVAGTVPPVIEEASAPPAPEPEPAPLPPAPEPEPEPPPPPPPPIAKAEPPATVAKAVPEPQVETATPRPQQEILNQVLPDVPAQARETIRGRVQIRVRAFVDSSGSVVDAVNQSPNASAYFGNLAVEAAKQWKFAPPPPDGPQSNVWTLQFEFRPDASRPVTVRATSAMR